MTKAKKLPTNIAGQILRSTPVRPGQVIRSPTGANDRASQGDENGSHGESRRDDLGRQFFHSTVILSGCGEEWAYPQARQILRLSGAW